MSLSIEEVKSKAMEELEPMVAPAKSFIEFVKKSLVDGVDLISDEQIANWLFSIPILYGELRCIEVDCLLTQDLIESQADKVKAETMDACTAQGMKVTDARNAAASATNELLVKQSVAKYMAKYINALWSQLEMLIFSVRNVFEARNQKVRNDV